MKWQPGRQGTGYFKLPIIVSKRLGFDVYVLKYPPDSWIDYHTDPVPGKKHYRLNVILKQADGGEFVKMQDGKFRCQPGRVHFFRPDIEAHAVCLVEEGTRYVLSIGWVRNVPD